MCFRWWVLEPDAGKRRRPSHVTRDLVLRVASYARPYKFKIALALAAILVSTLLGLAPPLLYRNLIDHALPEKDLARLNLLVLGMVLIPAAGGLIDVGQRWLTARHRRRHHRRPAQRALCPHAENVASFFHQHENGRTHVEAQQRRRRRAAGRDDHPPFDHHESIPARGGSRDHALLDWRLTLLSLVIVPLFILPSRRVGRILRDIAREQLDLNAHMNTLMNETLNVSGALLVKLFGRQPDEVHRFAERAEQVRDIGIRQAMVGRWFFMGLALVGAAGTALVWWVGGYLCLMGQFTIGTIVAFAAYLAQLYSPVSTLGQRTRGFGNFRWSPSNGCFEMLDLPVEIGNAPNANSPQPGAGRYSLSRRVFFLPGGATGRERSGQFGNAGRSTGISKTLVRVAGACGGQSRGGRRRRPYPAGNAARPVPRWALRNVDFEIRSGQLAALVGPSGAGKTTITYLIPRLYDPTEGCVAIDGHDLTQVTLESLTAQVGMVTGKRPICSTTPSAPICCMPRQTPRRRRSSAPAGGEHS